MNCFVFDIETVPDVELGRRMLDRPDDDDATVAEAMLAKRREETGGSDFLPFEMHRIVAISAALRTREQFNVWSLGEPDSSEAELVTRFFAGIDKFRPTLVSWNGGGFDLPVLQYRALKHGVVAPRYWDTGDLDQSSRYSHYLGRYHWKHIDLMDVLALYQGRGRAKLEHVAMLLGLPGKLGMSGDQVWPQFRDGRIADIRAYCETDVFNTYLVFLRFELIRGRLSEPDYETECLRAREWLAARTERHWQEFRTAWATG